MIAAEIQQLFTTQAIAAAPNEAAAILVLQQGQEVLLPLTNLAKRQGEDIIISRQQIDELVADGELLSLIHSHTNGNPELSMVDKVSCERMGIPWHVLCLPQQIWTSYEPTGYTPPLVNRDWSWGILDCWALVRDAYRQFGILLNDYDRGPLYGEDGRYVWHQPGWDRFTENFLAEGFVEVNDIQPYDFLVMRYRCANPNHGALLLRGGYILHHMLGRRSEVTLWDGTFRQQTSLILRHTQFSQAMALTYDLQLY